LSAVPVDLGEVSVRLAALVSELATNAILHAETPFSVIVSRDSSWIRVSVRDGSPAVPVRKDYGPQHPTGRGLMIVESMADRWGVDTDADGKTVWVEIDHRVPA
jgi:anti-sigma regulatory factor (Ser/Thr protein kinase)